MRRKLVDAVSDLEMPLYPQVLDAAFKSSISEPFLPTRKDGSAMEQEVSLVERGAGLDHPRTVADTAKLAGLWNHFLLVARVSQQIAVELVERGVEVDPDLAANFGISIHLGQRLRDEGVRYQEARFSSQADELGREVFFGAKMLEQDFPDTPPELLELLNSWGDRPSLPLNEPISEYQILQYCDLRCTQEITTLSERFANQFIRFYSLGGEVPTDEYRARHSSLARVFKGILEEARANYNGGNLDELREVVLVQINNLLGDTYNPNHPQYPLSYLVRGYLRVICENEARLLALGIDVDNLDARCSDMPEWESEVRKRFLQQIEPYVKARIAQLDDVAFKKEFPAGTWIGDFAHEVKDLDIGAIRSRFERVRGE